MSQPTPDDARTLLRLSLLDAQAGHYREGRRHALLAHATAPTRPDLVAELVARLRTYNESGAIRDCLRRLGPIQQIPIPLLLQFAQRLSSLNQQREALRFLDEARRGDPAYPPTLAARAQVLIYLGRFEEAERELELCIGRAPEFAQPHWLLARLRKWSPDRNHVARLTAELRRPGRRPEDIVLLDYALHKELDDLGRHEEAWAALASACQTQRNRIRYDTNDSIALVDALIALPALRPPDPIDTGVMPVFIVGMHRSGTTLLEQLLAGHGQVVDMGELYDFTAQMRLACDHHCRGVLDVEIVRRAPAVDFAAVARGYLEGIAWRLDGRRVAVDKLPSNFLNLGFILTALPQARVLHMVRDPMETCFSNLRELFADACLYSYDQIELADYYRQYQRLMAHWHRRFPGRIHDVRYDELVADPERCLRGIAAYCGMEFEPGMLEPGSRAREVATASAVQVRGAIARPATPKWVPYAAHLQALAARLAAPAAPA